MNSNKELLLFPNMKARDIYIESLYSGKTINTTNIQTLALFFRTLLNNFDLNNSSNKKFISSGIASIYMAGAFDEYIKQNENSIFKSQPNKYEMANCLYSLYEEIELSLLNTNNDNLYNELINYSKNIRESINIILIYKEHIASNNLYDEFMLYKNFIEFIKNNSESYKKYDIINVFGFEHFPVRYSIFLKVLSKYCGVQVNIKMPYSLSLLKSFGNFEILTKDIEDLNIEYSNTHDLPSALISLNSDVLKNYKDNIEFLAGFGSNQEIDNIFDSIFPLINNNVALYDIAIVFDNAKLYHDKIVEKCIEYNIPFNERRGEPIWSIPLIPVITSLFSIVSYTENGKEIDVDMFLKLLSSPYIKFKFINHITIREFFYSKKIFNLYHKMPVVKFIKHLKKEKFRCDYSIEEITNTAESVLELLKHIEELNNQKSFTKITSIYLNILTLCNVATNLKNNETSFNRDYNALSIFIDLILKMSIDDINIATSDYSTIINIILRDTYIPYEQKDIGGITLSSLYDMRGAYYKHTFIIGLNSTFALRKPDTFIINAQDKIKINNDYNRDLFNTNEVANILSRSLFANIISKLDEESKLYLSFRYKDDNGNIELLSIFVEEIFYGIFNKDFNFENLKSEGLKYRENYIEKSNKSYSYKENLVSLFYHKDSNYYFDSEIYSKIENIYKRSAKNNDELLESGEISQNICNFFLSKPLGVREVDELMKCPQRFVYNNIIGEGKDNKLQIGVDRMSVGYIYHKFFEIFYKTLKEKYRTTILTNNIKSEYYNIAENIIDNILSDKNEKEIDIKVLSNDMKVSMKIFIDKELLKEDDYYEPTAFEEIFNDYEIYKNIKINGIIDRVDFIKDSNEIINSIRIVDYKASKYGIPDDIKNKKDESEVEKIKRTKKELLTKYLQPLLYLDYSIKNYSSLENIENLSVAFSIYKKEYLLDNNYFISFNESDLIKSILSDDNLEINNDNRFLSLRNYIGYVVERMSIGIIDYFPSKALCEKCPKNLICKNVLLVDINE